jgi:hypothetical protein
MTRNALVAAAVLFLLPTILAAQDSSHHRLSLPARSYDGWTVVTTSGETLPATPALGLRNDTLLLGYDSVEHAVALQDLQLVEVRTGTHIGEGAGWGALIGGVSTMAVISPVVMAFDAIGIDDSGSIYFYYGVAGAVGGGLLGGLVGALIPKNEVVSMRGATAEFRLDAVARLLGY